MKPFPLQIDSTLSNGHCVYIYALGGEFKHFLFSTLPGEMIQLD